MAVAAEWRGRLALRPSTTTSRCGSAGCASSRLSNAEDARTLVRRHRGSPAASRSSTAPVGLRCPRWSYIRAAVLQKPPPLTGAAAGFDDLRYQAHRGATLPSRLSCAPQRRRGAVLVEAPIERAARRCERCRLVARSITYRSAQTLRGRQPGPLGRWASVVTKTCSGSSFLEMEPCGRFSMM